MSLGLPPGIPLSQIPVGKPPAGIESNFVDPPSLQGLIVGVCTAMMVLTFIFVFIRLFVAFHHKNHKLNLDDYCCIAATVLSFTYVALVFTLSKVHRHSWNVPLSSIDPRLFKTHYALNTILGPMMFLAKSSLLLLYLRVFGLEKAVRNTIFFTLAFMFCLYWIGIPISAYYCAPSPGKDWSLFSMGEKCRKSKVLGLVQGSLNVVLDLLIISLPVPVVLGLQMSLRKRVAVLVVFLTGILAVAASIIGLVYRVKLFIDGDLWNSAIAYICITIETDVSIICSSMPMLPSFFKFYVANSPYLSSLRDRLASRLAVSKTRLFPQPAQLNSPNVRNDDAFSPRRFGVGPYSKWAGVLDVFNTNYSSVHTKIYTTDHASIEEGIIMESLSVEQSAHAQEGHAAADRV